ncbi:hypothetical protein DFJ58DRAFT_723312 [Suillus subalutaceus]|uniref:uncharacterized protein n=1 Tax=Suillus subalutaceus TaxID=48586 RepID=UPI001B8795D2|nr:uncharacterized protein DFJ58DRAFT_723312 [Suillus subalutaceus]KAG1869452.1 hypothetical protein DFJ58DRAFT_723312 [Suillus subalutaceus]
MAPPSPTPIPQLRSISLTSSSSSLSTTSTRTAVPAPPRPKLARQQSASSTSAISDSTITRSPRRRYNQSMPRRSSSASGVHIFRISPVDHSVATAQLPTSPALFRSYFNHYSPQTE